MVLRAIVGRGWETGYMVCVCNLVFIIPLRAAQRAMAPVVVVYRPFPWHQTGLAGHSRAPNHHWIYGAGGLKPRCRFILGIFKAKCTVVGVAYLLRA